jgi:hypothetical protein
MKFVVEIMIPNEPFNTFVREGTAGQKIRRVLEETRPEAIYFTTQDHHRGGVAIYNLNDASQIPGIAEPWFLSFDATMDARPCMTPEDLGKSGLDQIGKKWS